MGSGAASRCLRSSTAGCLGSGAGKCDDRSGGLRSTTFEGLRCSTSSHLGGSDTGCRIRGAARRRYSGDRSLISTSARCWKGDTAG